MAQGFSLKDQLFNAGKDPVSGGSFRKREPVIRRRHVRGRRSVASARAGVERAHDLDRDLPAKRAAGAFA